MLSQVRVKCSTTHCATLFFPQLPAVAAAHGDVQRLRVQAEEGLILMCARGRVRLPTAKLPVVTEAVMDGTRHYRKSVQINVEVVPLWVGSDDHLKKP
jgi:hypothetical protein